MKKILSLLLLLILCLGTAQAAEWGEGLGPHQPHLTVPEVDLSETIGYMMFYPNDGLTVENVGRTLYIYLPREDVSAGESAIELRALEDKATLRIAMDDETLIRQRPMKESELYAFLWGGGTCFEIWLPKSLEFGKTYVVSLAKGCIVAENGVSNSAIDSAKAWSFSLAGDYGVGGLTYRRPLENGQYLEGVMTPQPGDEICFDILLGGEAQSAALYSREATVDFPVAFAEASGSFTGVVTGDEPAWGVMFFDAQGKLVKNLAF